MNLYERGRYGQNIKCATNIEYSNNFSNKMSFYCFILFILAKIYYFLEDFLLRSLAAKQDEPAPEEVAGSEDNLTNVPENEMNTFLNSL